MLEKIKQNAETLIEISYAYEGLLNEGKKKKIEEIKNRICRLVKENTKEIEEAKLAVENAK